MSTPSLINTFNLGWWFFKKPNGKKKHIGGFVSSSRFKSTNSIVRWQFFLADQGLDKKLNL